MFVKAGTALQLELGSSKTTVASGEAFQISLTLKNASTGNLQIGNITIPGIENFKQAGTSRSTRIQMVNGATMSVNEIIINLVAIEEGVFEIGPVEIVSGGLSAKSNVEKITVKKSEKKSFFGNQSNDKRDTQLKAVKPFPTDTILNIAAAFLLGGLLYALYRQKYGQGQSPDQAADDSVEKSTLDKLILSKIDDSDFFRQSKEQILLFLQKKHGIDTEILTTREVVAELDRKKVYRRNDIERSLELCDQGSFARNDSIKEELINIVKDIY